MQVKGWQKNKENNKEQINIFKLNSKFHLHELFSLDFVVVAHRNLYTVYDAL